MTVIFNPELCRMLNGFCSTQVVFIVNLGTPLVKANDALLSFTLLFSLVVTFLCSIVFLGEPQHWSCMTSQVALALGFALCLSSIMGLYTPYQVKKKKQQNPLLTVTDSCNL